MAAEFVMGSAITGLGSALPEGLLTSTDLAARFEVEPEWILERTGVVTRSIAAENESTSSLATQAARGALDDAGVEADQLDLVMVATCTPDYQLPATASLVQNVIGAKHAGAFDLGAACAGFLYGLAQATAFIGAGLGRKVLLCGSETLSRITDYSDLRSCVLFGDGAGAVVIEAVDRPARLGPFRLSSDGSLAELLYVPPEKGVLKMDGREVYKHAVEAMAVSVQDIMSDCGLSPGDVDLLIAHQANLRILNAVAARLGLQSEQVVTNIDRVGNTSAASIPLALADAVADGRLEEDDQVVVTAFGGGFAWGSGLVRWGTGDHANAGYATASRAGG